jgi:acyl carrier protein phosphodiesterase
MNFFGHLLLAEDNDESRIGNYLGDFVKGYESRINELYPGVIAAGIINHRRVDRFTDAHSAVIGATALMKPFSGKFSPVVIDILMDYFLIKHWKSFSSEDIQVFIAKCYVSMHKIVSGEQYPELCRRFTGKLIERDAFNVYSTIEGIHDVLCGMNRHLKRPSPLPEAKPHIIANYSALEEKFLLFMPDMLKFGHVSKRVRDS